MAVSFWTAGSGREKRLHLCPSLPWRPDTADWSLVQIFCFNLESSASLRVALAQRPRSSSLYPSSSSARCCGGRACKSYRWCLQKGQGQQSRRALPLRALLLLRPPAPLGGPGALPACGHGPSVLRVQAGTFLWRGCRPCPLGTPHPPPSLSLKGPSAAKDTPCGPDTPLLPVLFPRLAGPPGS